MIQKTQTAILTMHAYKKNDGVEAAKKEYGFAIFHKDQMRRE